MIKIALFTKLKNYSLPHVRLYLFLTPLAALFTASALSAVDAMPAIPENNALAIPFVVNKGQIKDSSVLFHTRTFSGAAFVKDDGSIVYTVPAPSAGKMAVLAETLVGAMPVKPAAGEAADVQVNFFRGARAAWRSGTPCFHSVEMPEIYPGIDMRLRAYAGNIEKIFTVAPGADPGLVRLRLDGVQQVRVNGQGELEAVTGLGVIRFTKPVAWQEDKAEAGRQTLVEVAYAVYNENEKVFGFELGDYDCTRPLVIDPLLAGTFIGGSGADIMTAVVCDEAGNVYSAGFTDSSDFEFPAATGVITNYQGGLCDVLVAKHDAQMASLLSATFLGGDGEDQATAITFNPTNNCLYIGGKTYSTDFTGGGVNRGGQDGFVVRLDTDLLNPITLMLGGESDDAVLAIKARNNQIYVVGETGSTDFNLVKPGALQPEMAGETDAFVAILHPDFHWHSSSATYLGGADADAAYAVTVDAENYIIIAGETSSTNFPTVNVSGTSAQTNRLGITNAFITKLDDGIGTIHASTYLGGGLVDSARAVAVDISNNVYVAGITTSPNFPTTNIFGTSYSRSPKGGTEAFVTRLSPELSNFQASTFLGGTSNDAAMAIAVYGDTNGVEVVVAGYTYSTNYPTTPNVFDRSFNGAADACLSKFDGTLTNLLNSTFLGGNDYDAALAMFLTADTNYIYLVGATASTNFPIPGLASQPEYAGGRSDGFLVKFAAAMEYGGLKWKYNIRDNDTDSEAYLSSPAMGWDGTIYSGAGSNLYAFNPDGSLKWICPLEGRTRPVGIGGDYTGLGSTPAVDTNGNIYIGASSGQSDSSRLYSVSPTGMTNWFVSANGAILSSPAIGSDGTIYFGTYLNTFYAINSSNMNIKWFSQPANTVFSSSPAIGTNGTVYAMGNRDPDGGILYAFDSDNGATLWYWEVPGNGIGFSSPMIHSNGWIFIAGGSNIYALSDDGSTCALKKTWTTPNDIFSSPAIDANNNIYVGSGSNLYSFYVGLDGAGEWSRPLDSAVKSSPAIGEDGLIYIGSASNVYAFTPEGDGTTNWSYRVEGTGWVEIIFNSPIIGTDGTVYMSDGWYVYALYGAVPPEQNSAWPMFRHDVLRTGDAGFDPRRFSAPTGVTASKGDFTNKIEVSWNAISNVVHYEVWRSATNDTATAARVRLLSATNYTDTAVEPGRIYYYWLRAKTHVVTLSDFSEMDFGGTPPLPPPVLTASKGVPDTYVELTWDTVDFGVTYKVYRSHDNDNDTNTATLIATLTTNTYDDTYVTNHPGRTHYYWVSAANTAGYYSALNSGDGTNNAGGIPPAPPLNLTAGKGLTSTNVSLAWDAAAYASAYVIYRHTESNAPSVAMAIFTNGTETTYNDRGAVPFKPYYYWVRATNQYGLSGYSQSDFGYTVLLPPLSVRTSVDQANRVLVSWELESTSASSYVIYRGATTNPADSRYVVEVAFSSPDATNFTDFGITRGNEYYYFVKGRNEYDTSDYSPRSNLGGTYPLPPAGVDVTGGAAADMIRVTWSASVSPGTRGYRVYRATTFDPNYAALIGATSGGLAYDDTGTEPGQRYYYWITATNMLGESQYSGVNSGWRPLAAPGSVSASYGDSTNHIVVTWGTVRNAARYEVWRAFVNSTNAAQKLENDWVGTSYRDVDTGIGVIYYYWIKAKNDSFVSAFSDVAAGFRALGNVDLAVNSLFFKPNVLTAGAHPVAVSFEIVNRGPNNMVSPNSWVTADFYISANPNFVETESFWMGALNLNLPMHSGAARVYVLTAADLRNLYVPALTPGSYYMFVCVRHTLPSKWKDPDLSNNYRRRAGKAVGITEFGGAIQPWNDYDGDGKSDPAVYRAVDGRWWVWMSGSGYAGVTAVGLGGADYVAVPADYDGDGRTDPAVYRAADGRWWVWMSGSGYAGVTAAGLGGADYVAVPADYDGDGRTDPAVYRAVDGNWRVWMSGSGYSEVSAAGLGSADANPIPGGYDYDAMTDPAVYTMSAGYWRIWQSAFGYPELGVSGWGGNGLMAVPGDYNGDGLSDLALYHAETGYWFVRTVTGDQLCWGILWGGSGFIPVPGDYDGDGVMDMAVYHSATGAWYVRTMSGVILGSGVVLGGPDYVPAGGIY